MIWEVFQMIGTSLVVVIFSASGVAKLFALNDFRIGLMSIPHMHTILTYPIAWLLPPLELVVAAALYWHTAWARPIGILLFIVFNAVILLTLRHNLELDCNCFGKFGARKLTKKTFNINLLLILLLVSGMVLPTAKLNVIPLCIAACILLFWVGIPALLTNRRNLQYLFGMT